MRFGSSVQVLFVVLSAWLAAQASAQNFPERPVSLIVPYSAGGATDVAMRALADAATKQLSQRVIA